MHILHQIEMHKLYAHLHMTKAIIGEYKKRIGNVFRGNGKPLKEQEILEDTIQTAKRHISLFMECADTYNKQLGKKSKLYKDIDINNLKKFETWDCET